MRRANESRPVVALLMIAALPQMRASAGATVSECQGVTTPLGRTHCEGCLPRRRLEKAIRMAKELDRTPMVPARFDEISEMRRDLILLLEGLSVL